MSLFNIQGVIEGTPQIEESSPLGADKPYNDPFKSSTSRDTMQIDVPEPDRALTPHVSRYAQTPERNYAVTIRDANGGPVQRYLNNLERAIYTLYMRQNQAWEVARATQTEMSAELENQHALFLEAFLGMQDSLVREEHITSKRWQQLQVDAMVFGNAFQEHRLEVASKFQTVSNAYDQQIVRMGSLEASVKEASKGQLALASAVTTLQGELNSNLSTYRTSLREDITAAFTVIQEHIESMDNRWRHSLEDVRQSMQLVPKKKSPVQGFSQAGASQLQPRVTHAAPGMDSRSTTSDKSRSAHSYTRPLSKGTELADRLGELWAREDPKGKGKEAATGQPSSQASGAGTRSPTSRPPPTGTKAPFVIPDSSSSDSEPSLDSRKRKQSGAGGGGRDPPRPRTAPGPPDPSDSSGSDDGSDFDRDLRDRKRRRIEREERDRRRALMPPEPRAIITPADVVTFAQTAAPIRPEKYRGKPEEWHAWWGSVQRYLTRARGLITDLDKIYAVGELLSGDALVWFQAREDLLRESGALQDDSWNLFQDDLVSRWKSFNEADEALDKMKDLKYDPEKGMKHYLTLIEQYNARVKLSGVALVRFIKGQVPYKIYSKVGGQLANSDADIFIRKLKHKGFEYELAQKDLERDRKGKGGNSGQGGNSSSKKEQKSEKKEAGKTQSTNNHPAVSSVKGKSKTTRKKQDSGDNNITWPDAHKGISQEVVDSRKKEKRCTICAEPPEEGRQWPHRWRDCPGPIRTTGYPSRKAAASNAKKRKAEAVEENSEKKPQPKVAKTASQGRIQTLDSSDSDGDGVYYPKPARVAAQSQVPPKRQSCREYYQDDDDLDIMAILDSGSEEETGF